MEFDYNPRVFDYHLDFQFLDAQMRDDFFLPPAKVIYSEPNTGISNMIVYGLIQYPPYVERFAEVKDNTIVLAISGAYKNDDGAQAASFGVWFGDSSLYNANGQLPKDVPQTFQSAELYAVKTALEILRNKIIASIQHKGLDHVFILTESKYIKESLAKDIWKWESNSYMTARKTPVANSDALKEVHELIKAFEAAHIAVQFWVVDKKYNKDAGGLAREALTVEEDEGQEVKKKSKEKKKPKKEPDTEPDTDTEPEPDTAPETEPEMEPEKKPEKGKEREDAHDDDVGDDDGADDSDAPDASADHHIPGFIVMPPYTGNMELFSKHGLTRDDTNFFLAHSHLLYGNASPPSLSGSSSGSTLASSAPTTGYGRNVCRYCALALKK